MGKGGTGTVADHQAQDQPLLRVALCLIIQPPRKVREEKTLIRRHLQAMVLSQLAFAAHR